MSTETEVERWSYWKARLYTLCSGNPRSNREVVQVAAPGPDDHVVDIGCGAGAAVRRTAATGARATGVDPSAAMVELARRRSDDVDGVRFEVGDAAHLPFDDGAVTLALAIATYHHWPDQPAGLTEVRRVLAPGGRAFIAERRLRRSGGHGLSAEQADEVAMLLGDLGYRDVRVQERRLRFATMLVISAMRAADGSAG